MNEREKIKKQKEKNIVINIYNSSEIIIKDSEQPDFIIESSSEKFGVEVTELYLSESEARLNNYSGYKEKILNSNDNSVLDKRDVGTLSKQEVYMLNNITNEWIFLFDFVHVKYDDNKTFHSKPSYDFIENKIIETIDIKDNKAEKYQKSDYNELLINCPTDIPESIIKKLYTSQKIFEKVNNSKFKRVYLLSEKYLCIYGDNPRENLEKYNVRRKPNE